MQIVLEDVIRLVAICVVAIPLVVIRIVIIPLVVIPLATIIVAIIIIICGKYIIAIPTLSWIRVIITPISTNGIADPSTSGDWHCATMIWL